MSAKPTKQDILTWIIENPSRATKRDIARAFSIKGAARIKLKHILRELGEEGHLEKRGKEHHVPGELPSVCVLEISGETSDGDLLATALEKTTPQGSAPRINVITRSGDPALGVGDRVLAKLTKVGGEKHTYDARLIRRLGESAPTILGIFEVTSDGGLIQPVEKRADRKWRVAPSDINGATDGELVEATATGRNRGIGLPQARIIKRLGDPEGANSFSLISIHQNAIPYRFPADVESEAENAPAPNAKDLVDLTSLPFVTIDPADARDHDDACYAMADESPENPGGFRLWIAIADVAHYVRPGSKLDSEARKRGNSTYFPDRVVPMLPQQLSGDLCSLHEGVERPCIALEIVLSSDGEKRSHRFVRAMMKSRASLSYEEAQAAFDGSPNARTQTLWADVLSPLLGAYKALKRERARRQPLDLDLPERRIVLNEDGSVDTVNFRDRFDAHKAVEEFMVLANVCAAETLVRKRCSLLFRVHEEPAPERLDALRETAKAAGYSLSKGQVLFPRQLNALLNAAAGSDDAELINISTLRSMQQAYYNTENFGHFGLSLKSYAHFTSPIRRYADLIVHRALISAHNWGEDGLSDADIAALDQTAKTISATERRSMVAERDTNDRYLTAYLAERVGDEFHGRIAGVARFGVFVKLDETGADGLVPIRELGDEYFEHDRDQNTLKGRKSGRVISLGLRVRVKLREAVPVTGGLLFGLIEIAGKPIAKGTPRHGRSRPTGSKPGGKPKKATKRKAAKKTTAKAKKRQV